MDKKYVGYWLGLGVIIMVFMTCPCAMAANKVVVVPLNTSPKNVSLKVYDNGGQYLGLFIGNNGDVLEILVPTIGKILPVYQQDEFIVTFGTGHVGDPVDWYYLGTSCLGTPYLKYSQYSSNGSSHFGMLYLDNVNTSDFFASNLPPGDYLYMESKRSQNGTGQCTQEENDFWFSPITTYTDAEVGFSDPVTFPLQFRME